MAKSNTIYRDHPTVYAKYYHPQSDDFLEYKSAIQIEDSGQQSMTMKLKFVGIHSSFVPMLPETHTIKAKGIIDLYLK